MRNVQARIDDRMPEDGAQYRRTRKDRGRHGGAAHLGDAFGRHVFAGIARPVGLDPSHPGHLRAVFHALHHPGRLEDLNGCGMRGRLADETGEGERDQECADEMPHIECR